MPCSNRNYPNARRGWHLAVCAGLALLAACQPAGPVEHYRNYLERLGRTLSVQVPPVTTTIVPRPPRPGQLQLALSPGKLDSLDFLAISGCAVQVTIGKRNSSLGRMARPSQRLLLDLEYLRLAPECVAWQRDNGREELATTLQQAWELKRLQLPGRVFNATLGSEEYHDLWRPSRAAKNYPNATGSQVITALRSATHHTQRWLAGDFQADNLELELLLRTISSGDAGTLLRALAVQNDWLAAADQMLDKRMSRGPLCTPARRPDAADILPNVVRRYFVGNIQPRAAALGRRYHELLPAIAELEEVLDTVLPDAYRQWQRERQRQLQQLSLAPRRHVKQLVTVQQPCARE